MDDIIIRKATPADIDGVTAVFVDELRHHVGLLPDRFQLATALVTPEWYDEVLANPDKILLVADLNGQIIGQVLLLLRQNPKDPIFRPRRFVDIDELAVAEGYRGQGIGRRLMSAAHDWARAHDVFEIELDVWEANSGAIDFYEKLGYEPIRRKMRRRLT